MTETETTKDDDKVDRELLESINKKHVRIRGSLDLKYPPKEVCCESFCGLGDLIDSNGRRRDHKCVLSRTHRGECEFSWECGLRRRDN